MRERAHSFPEGFLWGVATSSHQYEGATTNNQWHAWEAQGHIKTGDHCGLACDWWHRAEADFDHAQAMGLNALRLSLEWSRIEPRPGEWDDGALARYHQMLMGLHARGLRPLVTLHHFTHPLWFEERGGFLAPDAVERFARYVEHTVAYLQDRCDFWCTINEPNVYATNGYLLGDFPPGRKGDLLADIRVQGAMARAHAAAYATIHRLQPGAQVGIAQHLNSFDPARPGNPLDRLAARIQALGFNDLFLDALERGRVNPLFARYVGDLAGVKGTFDYFGFNTYARDIVSFDRRKLTEGFGRRAIPPGAREGDPGTGGVFGEIYPMGIKRFALRAARLGKPIYITESGVADAADRLRPWVIAMGMRAMHEARAEGADIRGYFHWSLVDNFEWAQGWSMRFGLIALDILTQTRTWRPSGELYRAIAQANRLTDAMIATYLPDLMDEAFPA